MRIGAAGAAPGDELGNIYTAVASLAVVNPRLRPPQPLAQCPLAHSRLFPQLAEQRQDSSVRGRVLGLGHAAQRPAPPQLTRNQCQTDDVDSDSLSTSGVVVCGSNQDTGGPWPLRLRLGSAGAESLLAPNQALASVRCRRGQMCPPSTRATLMPSSTS